MAKQSGKSNLLAKYGDKLRKAHEAHKNDETTFSGFGELPPGIENGIAQLVEAKFDVYKEGANQGEVFFYMAGTVKAPLTAPDGTPIEGLRTSITEALCDTPQAKGKRKTIDDHIQWIYNELRKLGVETKDLNIDSLESTVAALKKMAPHFRFRTWKGKPSPEFPDPRTQHSWSGLVDYHGVSDNGVVDTSDEEEEEEETEEEEEEEEPEETPPPKPGKKPGRPKAEAFDEFGDLKSLVKKANAKDQKAQDELERKAVDAGYTEEEVDAAKSWEDVVKMIENPKEEEEEEADDDTPPPPEKGEVVRYQPPKSKKAVECEIVAVDEDDETVTLKNLVDGKTKYTDVKWSEIEG